MDVSKCIGITDTGQPIVTPEQSCECFKVGEKPLMDSRTCWYCRYADFRKTTAVRLGQSICRCPQNQVPIEVDNKNENQEIKGGNNYVWTME